MNFASNYAFISQKGKANVEKMQQEQSVVPHHLEMEEEEDLNLNVFIVTFEGVKKAEKELSGGDPYECKQCKAILNKFSKVFWQQNISQLDIGKKIELGKNQAFWKCQFCSFQNVLKIQKEQVPLKDDVVYMLEGSHKNQITQNDSTLVFCIDSSGSMNSTTEIEGKVDLKYGISEEQIEMLRQFMEPGDQLQLNNFPGAHNQNKTYISRKQCILSAIQSQLDQIKKTDPHKKIGFVIFNNEVTVIGDSSNETVHIVGDKLYQKETVIGALSNFKLKDPIIESHQNLLSNINKADAKGQTALGPALVTALNVASKGSPGSSVILCTDGLANIGIGQLQPYDEIKKQFYIQLGQEAKSKNITVNIITIKGQGCKMEAIGKLAEITNGNIKVVNPEKLSQDFANILKDEVVGINVVVRVILHKAMTFRNEPEENLRDQGTILERLVANATKNTRISFQYEVKSEEALKGKSIDLSQLKKIPFQAQIEYTSTTGAKFLRVVTSECDTTTQKLEMKKQANLGVVHHRVTSQTAALYNAGNFKESTKFNNKWAQYLQKNFQDKKFREHQNKFVEKNQRLNKAIRHRHKKSIEKKKEQQVELSEEEIEIMERNSDISSDSDQKELVDNIMERQCYSICKRPIIGRRSNSVNSRSSDSYVSGQKKEKKLIYSPIRKQRQNSLKGEEIKGKMPLAQKRERKPSVQKKERKPSVQKRQRKKSVPRRRKSVISSGSDSS